MGAPQYVIERHTHGWLACPPPEQDGIPIYALSECLSLAPAGSVLDAGISHHFKFYRQKPSFAFGTKNETSVWRAEIEAECERSRLSWFFGTDVGTSSSAIFGVLADGEKERQSAGTLAKEFGDGHTPQDADDFGRCLRVVERFGWRDRLPEVAAAYPDTAWTAIVARWDDLAAAPAAEQTALLRDLNRRPQ